MIKSQVSIEYTMTTERDLSASSSRAIQQLAAAAALILTHFLQLD